MTIDAIARLARTPEGRAALEAAIAAADPPLTDQEENVIRMRAGLPLPNGAPLDAPAAIAMLLERRGCTSRQLAAALGVNPVTLSRWLNGRNRPRGDAWRRLREAVEGL